MKVTARPALNFQPNLSEPGELPVPTSGLQAALLLIKLLFPADQTQLRPESNRTLALFSRAWGKAYSFAYQILQKLEDRSAPPRHRSPESTRFQSVLRWTLRRDDANRPDDALGRFRELASTARSATDACEAFMTFHHAAASMTSVERRPLVSFLFDSLPNAKHSTVRSILLKAMLQHAVTDFTLDGTNDAEHIRAQLVASEVAACFEPTDLIYNLALMSAFSGSSCRKLVECRLVDLTAEELALVAYMLVVRLGAIPGLAHEAKWYANLFETIYRSRIQELDIAKFVHFASQYDYGVDLAKAFEGEVVAPVDLLPLLTHALALVGDTSAKRKRGTIIDPVLEKRRVDMARKISRRFCAWGRGHQVCRALISTPVFDGRLAENALSNELGWLTSITMKPRICGSVERLVLDDMVCQDIET